MINYMDAHSRNSQLETSIDAFLCYNILTCTSVSIKSSLLLYILQGAIDFCISAGDISPLIWINQV